MKHLLQSHPLIIDGGTGTELERLGVPMNSSAWSGEAVLSSPQVLASVHQAFLDAGAQMLIANTFAAARHNLESAGLSNEFERINTDAVRIVRDVVDVSNEECVVASGISTSTFSGSLDYSRLPIGRNAVAYWSRQAEIQVKAGSEVILLEMMRDIIQTQHALDGAALFNIPVWVGFSCFESETGEVFLLDTDIPFARALAEIDLSQAAAVGIMHTLMEHTPKAFRLLKDVWNGYTFAYPHAGYFIMPHWIFEDAITPKMFAHECTALHQMGVDAIGGCCGISPAHIQAMALAVHQAAGM